MISTGRVAVMVSSMCWFAANANANLVANGNFAGGTYLNSSFGPTDVLPEFWSLSPPNPGSTTDINVIGALAGYADPAGGTQYVAFQSAATSGQDCLNQFIPTVAGDVYTISFYAAMTASAVANTYLTAEWDSGGAHEVDMGGLLFSSTSGAATNGFLHFQFTETASMNNTLFYFHGDDANGAVLVADLVVTQDSPEPASVLLVGVALAGLIHHRRQRPARVLPQDLSLE
jgi:hypothetical protein